MCDNCEEYKNKIKLLEEMNKELGDEVNNLKERLKKYTNPERRKRYYEQHKEEMKEKAKEYSKKAYEKNPEKIKENTKKTYQQKKEKLERLKILENQLQQQK
jgi:hypothetical protein